MRLDVVHYESKRTLLTVGGLWDRRARDYVEGELPTKSKVITVHDGQLEAVRWFADWLCAFTSGDSESEARVWSALFGGGRRGGKTTWGIWAGLVMNVAVPGSKFWIASQSIAKSWETHAQMLKALPAQWHALRGAPWFEYTLVNGSMAWQKSAHNPDDLKQGGADIVLLNEGQKLDRQSYVNARGAIVDSGGCVLIAANPPRTAKGMWVLDHHEAIEKGKVRAKLFHFDFRKNPFIETSALDELADEVDERTAAMEIDGQFLQALDVVFYNWSRAGNEVAAPDLGDITEAYTAHHCRRPYGSVIAVDPNKYPYCAASSGRLYNDPDDPWHPKDNPNAQPLIYFDDSITVEGDEGDLSDEMLDAGYDPEESLIILDASGFYQGTERQPDRFSSTILKDAGWRHIRRPDRTMKKNPLIDDRVRACLRLVCTRRSDRYPNGKRRLFVDPELEELCEAMRKWETKGGVPYRKSKYAHLTDTAGYFVWYFFPRRRKVAKNRTRIIKRRTRRAQFRRV